MAKIQFVEQSHEVLGWYGEGPLNFDESAAGHIANVARTCYQSKPEKSDSPYSDVRIEVHDESQERLVRSLIKRGHEAMLEHSFLSVRFLTDRGVANEIVRHRLFSFAQESTRYVAYQKRGFRFVMPVGITDEQKAIVRASCQFAADNYEILTKIGATPEEARAVLPLCTATEIVVSGNMREWRHCLRLRTERHAHPQIRALFTPLLRELQRDIPVIFDDLNHDDVS